MSNEQSKIISPPYNKTTFNFQFSTFHSKSAFTLAETLIVILAVGIVSALVLPVVVNNVNNRQYAVARTKVHSMISEGSKMLSTDMTITNAADAEDFVKNYLGKKIKILRTCDSNNMSQCGLSNKITVIDQSKKISMPTNDRYAFTTINGFSMNLFYNPSCEKYSLGDGINISRFVCANIIYDTNGHKKPNQVGKDIGFVTILYDGSITVAPIPATLPVFTTKNNGISACNSQMPGYRMPNKDELFSIIFNSSLLGFSGAKGNLYLSSNVDKNNLVTGVTKNNSQVYSVVPWYVANILCVE